MMDAKTSRSALERRTLNQSRGHLKDIQNLNPGSRYEANKCKFGKNSMNGTNRRLNSTEGNISKNEKLTLETLQNETQREKIEPNRIINSTTKNTQINSCGCIPIKFSLESKGSVHRP